MSGMMGPDGKPATFDGTAWVSEDGRYWRNGAAWQPFKRRGFQPPIAVTAIVLLVLAGAWFVLHNLPKAPPEKYGVTNAKIDSSTEFEFDYRRSATCDDLTFDYLFYDKSGHQVDHFQGEKHNKVVANETVHFDVIGFEAIDARAVRFDAIPTCH